MKKFCLILTLIFSTFLVFAEENDSEKLKLAVMEFEDLSGKLSEETLSGASEYFRVIFAQTNRYIIISKDRQKDQISSLRKKYNTDPTYKSCTDKNCQIQLGQALSADLIVKTSISFFAGSYILASELIDLEKEATIIAATEEYDGSPQTLKTAIKNNVAKIVEAEKKENKLIEEEISEKTVKKNKKNNSVNSKDQIACEYARSESNALAWETYIKKYPAGECAEEAKDELDKMACKTAEKKNSEAGWREYLQKFHDGRCEFKAQTTLQKFEEKKHKSIQEIEKQNTYHSKIDANMDRIFTGKYNFGILVNFDLNKFGLSTGFDFNFNVFRKPYGVGAGNLFVGLGFYLQFYLPKIVYFLSEIPIMANFGYEFKVNNDTLRYIGLWLSPGLYIANNKNDYVRKAFAWKLGFDMIFKNCFLMNLGFGGTAYKNAHNSYFLLNIGTMF